MFTVVLIYDCEWHLAAVGTFHLVYWGTREDSRGIQIPKNITQFPTQECRLSVVLP